MDASGTGSPEASEDESWQMVDKMAPNFVA